VEWGGGVRGGVDGAGKTQHGFGPCRATRKWGNASIWTGVEWDWGGGVGYYGALVQLAANFMTNIGTPSTYSRALHGFCIVLMCATFVLLMSGGTVTSKGVGMSVPDWPTTFNENMFLAHPKHWFGEGKWAQFWEHSHRLMGSLVGMLTLIETVWLFRVEKQRGWLRVVAVALFVLVVVQGLMGGFRVTENSSLLAMIHGVHAQLFFALTILAAAATGPVWAKAVEAGSWRKVPEARAVVIGTWVLLGVLFVQLMLGAAVRHFKAGLAIYDFPTSYGDVLPPMNKVELTKKLEALPFSHSANSGYEIWQVHLHFAHRVFAMVVTLVAGWMFLQVYKRASDVKELARPAGALAVLILVQIALGASVIWTARQSEVTTLHQSTGALLLGTAVLLAIRVHLLQDRLKGEGEKKEVAGQ
jgi:heme a synthase